MISRILASAAFLAAACLAAGAAHAQVNKCVDANGKTVYSEAPCPANAKSKTLKSPPPAAPQAAAKPGANAEADYRKRQMEREDAEKKSGEKTAELKTKQENCTRAKAGLAQLEAGGRMSRFNDKGEREFMGDAELAQEKGRAKAAVDQWCSG